MAMTLLTAPEEVSFLYDIVVFKVVENHAGFLGIFHDSNESFRFFFLNIVVAFLLVLCLFYLFAMKNRNSRYDITLSLIVGGGISNLLDRLLGGGVIDFVSIGVSFFRTGIFNLADIYILLGSFFLGYLFFSSTTLSNP